jgi:hypothetical protein
MKKQKRIHLHNRRRKKIVTQQKAAYARCVEPMHPNVEYVEWKRKWKQWASERQFLMDTLLPFRDAIAQALIPHFQDVFEGEDPSDDSPEETVAYVIDLIGNITAYDDPIAATIHDIYRDGAEASLPHVKRAIKWHMAFDAHRRTLGAA